MSEQSFLGFDYGSQFIGIAVGSRYSGLAEGVTTVPMHPSGPDWQQIDKVIDEWQPDALVVGLPLNMDGTDTKTTKPARQFGEALKARYNRPIHMVDERLSTRTARQTLETVGQKPRRGDKTKLDKLAAQTILQSFLNDNPE
ncbi:MAG: Holliday junction resolvase RuvX [Proteobacteria bacterium]|nr:Holliday junction resolvase RuvX [Pseudomonadota bacterium]